MSITEHVQLTITQEGARVSRAGFGVMLVMSHSAPFTGTRTYSSTTEVAVDFATDSPEYLVASAAFSQTVTPPTIKIGRMASSVTQSYSITKDAGHVLASGVTYSVQVRGEGVTSTLATFTSVDAIEANIVAGIVGALNGVVGKNYTASGAAFPITVTADAANDWFSLEVKDVTILNVKQTHADPGVTADLNSLFIADPDFYVLYSLFNSTAYVAAVAAWTESQKRMYAADSCDSESVQVDFASGTDVFKTLKDNAYTRTIPTWHQSPASMIGAAWMGRILPLDPGRVTGKFKTLVGVVVSSLTSTQRNRLKARSANYYELVTGDVAIMAEGTVASGSFIDRTRNLDWLDDDMTKSVFEILAANDIVPYSEDGKAQIEGGMWGSLARAGTQGVVDAQGTPAPYVTGPAIADVPSADKTNRILRMSFGCVLQGAVHTVIIQGTVII